MIVILSLLSRFTDKNHSNERKNPIKVSMPIACFIHSKNIISIIIIRR